MLSDRNSLEQVSLKIKKGKITLIAGPSGSGKTTLLRHLKKELLPKGKRSGKVLYDGQKIEQLEGLRSVKEVGYLFQNPSAQMVMDTVWHEIAFGLENLGMPYEQMKRTVAEIINYFDLQKIYHEDTDKLSGGQKQLVNLAAVMAMHPKVFKRIKDLSGGERGRVSLAKLMLSNANFLILDEPTAQLDPAARKDFLVMLQKLHKEFGLTIILTSHNLEDVMEMSDECVILDDGKVIEQGNPKEVARHLQKTHHPLEQSLPQILRLEEKFQIEPTFSMEEVREQIRKKEYHLIKKTHSERKTVLSISHLYAGYEKGKDVLSNLSVEIKEGEIFVAVGANGSGKSTLLSCMAKQMKFDGKLKCKKKIVYMPQDPTLLFVKDQLFEDLLEMGKEKEVKIDKLLEMADLMREKNSHPYDLSGGQQQMAALIKVLLADPEILLLDEPTKGMDREHSRKFGELLRKFTDQGKTIFIVSHDLEFCAEYADRVGMMFDGKIEGIDEPSKFFAQNYFYTTECAKITRDFEKVIVLPQEVVNVC